MATASEAHVSAGVHTDARPRTASSEYAPGPVTGKAARVEEPRRSRETVTAEPPEEFLRAMGRHQQPDHQANQQQSSVHWATPPIPKGRPGTGRTITMYLYKT